MYRSNQRAGVFKFLGRRHISVPKIFTIGQISLLTFYLRKLWYVRLRFGAHGHKVGEFTPTRVWPRHRVKQRKKKK